MTLEELFAGRGFDVAAAQRRMAALMEAEGLPYGERTKTFNSRLAQELACWAETQQGGGQIHDALFRAYFVEGTNLANVDNLVAIAKSAGLDEREAREVLGERRFKEAVDADWARSRAIGITGVPTFVAGGRAAVGAQPYEVLEELVVAAGAERRG